ncbi:helix-turn-helix domain-containing protein [Haladaptatus sp. DYF46]|uniref:helix-turn-helix domain-containing protein n=1 Tax=Haladaptatus sp. DYF46 TaxID=2886041 RepID=UPI001E57F4DD|nr:helix-turn-helix domain-containing protein [Haladaptatus sp. DYF46]
MTKSTPTVASSEKAGIEQKLYDIVAEVSLSGPDLLLSPTIKAVSDVTIETEHLTGTTPKHLFISVRGEDFETFERELQQDYTVAEPVLVETYEGRRVYRLEPVSTVELIAPRCPELDARILDVESGDGGWVVRMQIPTRQALVSFREYCLENDVTFRVNQLGNATDHKETDVVGLTEKQKQLLRMAFECGYYEIPRRISQNELAHELDISTSAISQRLRRDTEQLIGSALAVTKKDH